MMKSNHNLTLTKTENPLLVYNQKGFVQMMNHLSAQNALALDTESDSLYRYYPRVCLIQITTYATAHTPDPEAVVDYLVDPLRLPDVSPLNLLLTNPSIQKVMHAASNDILTLQRDFHFTFQNIFDTQLAARILGWKRLGLAAMLEERFGVVSDKRMQRTDWGKRPLSPQQIAYAQMDTHYLLALRAQLTTELHTHRRWDEAQDAFARAQANALAERTEEERTVWQMKGIFEIEPADRAVVEALWQWREQEAQRRDRPPFKIMNDEVLIRLAQHKPRQSTDLRAVGRLSDQQAAQYSGALLAAISTGLQRPIPQPPKAPPRPEWQLDRPTTRRYDALRAWRSQVAEARDVTPDVIMTNETLLAVAQCQPRSESDLLALPELSPWQVQTYGADLLAVTRNGKL